MILPEIGTMTALANWVKREPESINVSALTLIEVNFVVELQ